MVKRKKKSAFRGKVNKDAKRQKAAGSSYGYLILPKGVNMYQPTPGSREMIDIMPYVVSDNNHPDKDKESEMAIKGELWYKRPFKVHRNVGSDNESVVCLTSFGKKCPICEYKKQQAKDGVDREELKEFTAKSRNLYVVIPKGVKKLEEEPHIFDMSPYLFQNLLNDELEESEDSEVFPDLEEGLTLKVRWSEEVFNKNKFADASRIDFLERDEAYDESILDDIPDLDKVLKEWTYEELNAKFFELDEEESEDDEEDEDKVKKPARKRKTTKKPKVEEEEEDEDEVELTWADLSDMAVEELAEVIEVKELDIDVDECDEDDLCEAVADELGIKVPKKKPAKKPVKKDTKKPEKKSSKKGKDKCPSGFKFGVDTDDNDECDSCKLWDDCIDKKEE